MSNTLYEIVPEHEITYPVPPEWKFVVNDQQYLRPVPANPDDKKAAQAWVSLMTGKGYRGEDAFLAGCTHKAAQQQQELEALRAWKQSALASMPDYQEIGKLIGVGLGEPVWDKIIPALKSMYTKEQVLHMVEEAWDKAANWSRFHTADPITKNPFIDKHDYLSNLKKKLEG